MKNNLKSLLVSFSILTIILTLVFPISVYSATNGDWEGLTDQDLAISFTVSGDEVTNFVTRIRIFCNGFSVLEITNHGSRPIVNDSFTVSYNTNACTPSEPWNTKPVNFAGNFVNDSTCNGTYSYSTTQAGTWSASSVSPPCNLPQIDNFSVSPNSIKPGENAIINWSISGADSANINQEIGSVDPVSGNINVSPQSTTVYTLTASNGCGTTNSSVTLSIIQPSLGLVAMYLFNGNADDTSGNGFNGEVVGATLTSDRFGNKNSAYLFDGLNDFIRLPSSNVFYSGSGFTWAIWVKPNNDGGAVISAADTIGCEDFQLGLGEHPGGLPVINENAVWATVDNVGGCSARNILDYVFPGGIVNDQFYHLALRVNYQGQLADLFLDGIKVQSTNISESINSRNMIMTIGAFRDQNDNPGLLFDGVLDDIYFYDRLLSETEIRKLASVTNLHSNSLPAVYNLLLNNNE